MMNIAAKGLIAFALTCGAIGFSQDPKPSDDKAVSVLQLPSPADRVGLQEPAPEAPMPTPSGEVMLSPPMGDACCNPCCPAPCVPTTFCLVDPCGCNHEACVNVPACCAGEQPEITWRGGIFGRQVATLCWNCCDFQAKVIVTHHGKVKVRDRGLALAF